MIATFQISNPMVCAQYECENIKVIEDASATRAVCAIYFSSNDIYFPNSEDAFRERIIENDSFEWMNCRIPNVTKHIYLRDIHKQWYLTGVNSRINSPEKLFDYLNSEIGGLECITIGSSAGGYAAVLFGAWLKAKTIYSFNGQFELDSLLTTTTELLNPLIFQYQNSSLRIYYDLRGHLDSCQSKVYYFCSIESIWDKSQLRHIDQYDVKAILFRTGHHGIPFLKTSLPLVLSLDEVSLNALACRSHNPLVFTLRYSSIKTIAVYLAGRVLKTFKQKLIHVVKGADR